MDESAIIAFAQQNGFPTSGPMFDYYRPQIEQALQQEARRKAVLGNQPGYQANDGSLEGGNSIASLMRGTNAAAGRTNQDGSAPTAAPSQPAVPSVFSVGPAGPQGAPSAGLAAVNQQLRPIGAQQVAAHQAKLNPQTMPGLADVQPITPVRTTGGAASTGATPMTNPNQPQTSSFNYWQQYSPAQANAALSTAPMRDAANAQLGAARQRRGWLNNSPRPTGT